MPWPLRRPLPIAVPLKPALRQTSASQARPATPTAGSFSYGNCRLRPSPASNARANRHALAPQTIQESIQKLNRIPSHILSMEGIKGHSDPRLKPASPTPNPLALDFARQAVARQQRSNYHSSTISAGTIEKMVSQSVNKTALHPGGVQYVEPSWTLRFNKGFKRAFLLTISPGPSQSTLRSRRSSTTAPTLTTIALLL